RKVLKRKSAQRKRQAGLHVMAAHFGELERAATQVADDSIRPVKAGNHPEGGKLRLALAGKNGNFGAADALRFGDEGLAVFRLATGGRGNRPAPTDVEAITECAKAPQSEQCLID